ncbi:MAG: hypothetical protein JWN47_2482 [Frankiales bacterium]|nr:hypothetical protein [Frankiales bacterium]
MAARRKTGLTSDSVAALATKLAEGKRVRVKLSDPQFGEGTTGAVVRIGDPAVDGADYITVRVTVNGHADELPFAPNELELPGRRLPGSAKPSRRRQASRPSPAASEPQTSAPPATTPAAVERNHGASDKDPDKDSDKDSEKGAAKMAAKAPAKVAAKAPAIALPAKRPDKALAAKSADAAAGRTPTPRRKSSTPPKITVTVTSSGASWSVSALRGAKSVAKSVAVPPGVVTAIADLLDQSGISAAVAEVNETALAEAEQRAAQLRVELAELDAVLAAHRSPR